MTEPKLIQSRTVPLVLVVVVAAVHTHRHGPERLVKLKDVMGFRVVNFEHEVLQFSREGVSDNGRTASTITRNRQPLANSGDSNSHLPTCL